AVALEAHGIAREAGQGELRGGLADEGRGNLAGIGPEAVGQEEEHGHHGERNAEAEPAHAHAGLRRSGRMASAPPRGGTRPRIQSHDTLKLTLSFTVACEPSRAKSPSTRYTSFMRQGG